MQKFSCVKLDAERDGKALAKQFSVDGYPTIIVLDEDGNVVDRIACGFNDADNFLRVVTGFEKEAADYPVLLEKLKSAPDTLTREDYLSLAPMLINHSQFVDTAIVLDKLRGFGEHDALGPLYNQLGDADMTAKRVIQARDAYTKTIGFTRDPDILYHAHLALANSYLATHENSSAVPHLQALLSFPKTSEPLKDQIQYTLRKIQGN
jgi:thioredoxin-like negative regulator of GroEL